MINSTRRSRRSLAPVVAAITLLTNAVAVAGPVRLPRGMPEPPALSAAHAAGAPLLHFHPVAPATRAWRESSAPSEALPLAAAPAPVRLLPMFLPRISAAVLSTSGVADCSATRPGVLIAALPATPFAPIACRARAAAAEPGDRVTTLVAGRNKNALYGRAYSPHDLDAP